MLINKLTIDYIDGYIDISLICKNGELFGIKGIINNFNEEIIKRFIIRCNKTKKIKENINIKKLEKLLYNILGNTNYEYQELVI